MSDRITDEKEVADLREQLAAAQSREVCTVAHSDEVMEFCPYCKIERLRGDLSETRIALANAECREGVAKARLAEAEKWHEAALRFGEHLVSVGPDGYYTMTPEAWLSWAQSAARTADSASAVQPERCCLDYPRCDCNSPPEPDNAPTLQPCGHPWEAQHDFKCILCSSPG